MQTIDQLYNSAREYAISDDLDNAGKCLEQVKERINNEIASSQRWYFIRNIENIYGAKKESFSSIMAVEGDKLLFTFTLWDLGMFMESI